MARKDVKAVAKRLSADDALINDLKGLVKGLPIKVLGKMDLTAARCCKGGTYAIVRIDMGDPARRK
jgi:hypothetical protein